jgi:hypothetical protein
MSVGPTAHSTEELKITAVMISCGERDGQREQTLRNLAGTDWGSTPVFVEMDTTTCSRRQERQTRTSYLALERALGFDAEYVLFLEDDLEFNRYLLQNLRAWRPLRRREVTLAGLYNPNIGALLIEPTAHLFVADPNRIYGSQCFLLSIDTVRYCVTHWEEVEGMQDIKLSRLAAQLARPIYYHTPSLVQHIGARSVWGGRFHQALDFERDWRCSGRRAP